MPPVRPKPGRNYENVKCVKKTKNKAGEDVFDLVATFDFTDPEWGLCDEIVAELKEVFFLFDKDNDGVLSFSEVQKVIKTIGRRQDHADLEKDVVAVTEDKVEKTLEYNEFLKMMAMDMKKDPTRDKEALMDAFRLFDKDEDGKLSSDELTTMMTSMGEFPLPKDQVDQLVLNFSADEDGLLDYEGFCELLCGGLTPEDSSNF